MPTIVAIIEGLGSWKQATGDTRKNFILIISDSDLFHDEDGVGKSTPHVKRTPNGINVYISVYTSPTLDRKLQ